MWSWMSGSSVTSTSSHTIGRDCPPDAHLSAWSVDHKAPAPSGSASIKLTSCSVAPVRSATARRSGKSGSVKFSRDVLIMVSGGL